MLSVDASLEEDALKLDEVVVNLGPSLASKRRELGNAINSVGGDAIANAGTGNALTALQGRVAGFGNHTNLRWSCRGHQYQPAWGKLYLRGSDPLYIIDGVIASNSSTAVTQTGVPAGEANLVHPRLADLNPNDIETISTINGAAAAAVYGSRAANGVVLITTKRGKAGKPTITVGTSINMNQLRQKYTSQPMANNFGFAAIEVGQYFQHYRCTESSQPQCHYCLKSSGTALSLIWPTTW